MKYINGDRVKAGDVITDGTEGRENVRLKNRAKVLYVDKYCLVWFPLNDFTTHSDYKPHKWISKDWGLTQDPIKIELSELTPEELEKYNNSDDYLN